MAAGILRNPSLLREILFVVKNTEGIGFAGLLKALLVKIRQKIHYLLSEKRKYG
jgi:hypothetical protein